MLKRLIRKTGIAKRGIFPVFSRPAGIFSPFFRVTPTFSTNRLSFVERSFSSFPKFLEEKTIPNTNSTETCELSETKNQNLYIVKEPAMQTLSTNPLIKKDSFDEQKPFETVTPKQMRDEPLDKINPDGRYQLGFARKEIVDLLPFTHSAAAFLDLNAKGEAKWLIFGRQTPFFLKGSHFFGGLNKLYHSLTDSSIANEKKYEFFPRHDFVVEKSDVILTGKEVKEILQNADKEVCENHPHNLIQSNCYSASIDVLAFAIDAIAKRIENTAAEHAENNRCINFIRERLLAHATQDNLHMWVGVITEPRVRAHLKAVDLLIAERYANNKFNPECRENEDHITPTCKMM